jgi:hypothetical protein
VRYNKGEGVVREEVVLLPGKKRLLKMRNQGNEGVSEGPKKTLRR